MDIFYHRSMEKDKLFVLDVCGAYGQKDIETLDRSEINKPACDNGGRLADLDVLDVVLMASMHISESAECRHENQLIRLGLTNLT